MLYLFSSDATPRYKTNILDVLCYPEKHLFRFRYQEQYVSPDITSSISGKSFSGESGFIIYAEITTKGPHREFRFYPIRRIEIKRIFLEGSIYYVDFKLGKFVDYGSGETAERKRDEYQRKIDGLSFRPLPLLQEDSSHKWGKTWYIPESREIEYRDGLDETALTQGYFCTTAKENIVDLSRRSDAQSWESVADILSRSSSMNLSVFYFVKGFYRVARNIVGKRSEKLIACFDDGWTTKYPIPMGKSAVLKLLTYRSEKSRDIFPQKLTINADKDVLAGISQREILIDSHYNEDRIELAFKRVFDSILSSISIEHDPAQSRSFPNETVLAPRPFFLITVTVPRRTVFFILTGLFFAPLLLTLSPDYLLHIGNGSILQTHLRPVGDFVARNAGDLSNWSKALAASMTLIAGYLGFRRLPIGK